jgi:hypothetical protein
VPDTTALDEIDREIAIVRDNLRQLTEQAAAFSGARDEELAADRIAEQEAQLAALMKRRELLTKTAKR